MSRKEVGIEQARKALGDLATAAQYGHTTIITRNGKPVARIAPLEDAMTTTVSREAILAWLGDNHGLTEEGISALVDKAAGIGREWPVADLHRGARLDRLWWTYQDIVEAAAPSTEEALATIHGMGRTGVDPWKPSHDERA